MTIEIVRAGDGDAVAWRQAVMSAGGTASGAQFRRVARLARSLKAGGVWTSLDRLWLFAAENATQAKTDLLARTVLTISGNPAFTAARGYKGDHSGHLDSTVNLSSFGGLFSRDSANFGCWVETAESAPASSNRIMGNDSSNNGEFVALNPNYAYSVNQGANNGGGLVSSTTGSFHLSRTAASGTNAVAFYYNGAFQAGASTASIAVANDNMFMLAGNNAGTMFQPSDARLAAAWFGGGLTATQVTAFYSALRAYMTSVGVA